MKTDWGAVLSDLRDERGISQRELARLSGVSRSSLRRIELGQPADLPTVEAILEALGYELNIHPKRRPTEPKDHNHGEAQSGRSALH